MTTEEFKCIANKPLLSVAEAVDFTGIGESTIRALMAEKDCDFVLSIGKKKLVKKDLLIHHLLEIDEIYV